MLKENPNFKNISQSSFNSLLQITRMYCDFLIDAYNFLSTNKTNQNGIAFNGTDIRKKYNSPSIPDSFEPLAEMFLNSMIKCYFSSNANFDIVVTTYLNYGYKTLASQFYARLPDSFTLGGVNRFLVKARELFNNAKKPKPEHSKQHIEYKTKFSVLESPSVYKKFLDCSVEDIDKYKSFKYSIESYASSLENEIFEKLSSLFDSVIENGKEARESIKNEFLSYLVVNEINIDVCNLVSDYFNEKVLEFYKLPIKKQIENQNILYYDQIKE